MSSSGLKGYRYIQNVGEWQDDPELTRTAFAPFPGAVGLHVYRNPFGFSVVPNPFNLGMSHEVKQTYTTSGIMPAIYWGTQEYVAGLVHKYGTTV